VDQNKKKTLVYKKSYVQLFIYHKLKVAALDGGMKKENLLRPNYRRVKKIS
jgi:hypothetical protein